MIIIGIVIICIIIRLYIDNNFIKTSCYEVASTKIPSSFNGYTIVQLSDLHNKKYLHQLIEKVEKQNPDIVVLTGDMVSANHTNFINFYDIAKKLAKKYQVYYIKGNHEGRMPLERYQEIEKTIQSYGITILDNDMVTIEKNKEYINLYGLWVNQRYYSRIAKDKKNMLTQETITKLLGKVNQKEYNVLLTHTPLYFKAYANWGADLTFSGHIHGGLVYIPFVGGLISPHLELFPEYCHGKYHIGESTLIVNSGLSKGSTAIRFLNRPEIVVVTLKTI